MRLIMLGAPGTGKGTQGELLENHFGVMHISTGEMFRDAMSKRTPVGREAQNYIDQGRLVPDKTVVKMVRERLQNADVAEGFILDGFPRTVAQAEAFNDVLAELGIELDHVIQLSVTREELMERLTGRRQCPDCEKPYNINVRPQEWEDSECEKTSKRCELTKRDDDDAEVILKRMEVYSNETAPLKEYYQERGLRARIIGMGPIPQVFERILQAL
jgi:adenylate kinase